MSCQIIVRAWVRGLSPEDATRLQLSKPLLPNKGLRTPKVQASTVYHHHPNNSEPESTCIKSTQVQTDVLYFSVI